MQGSVNLSCSNTMLASTSQTSRTRPVVQRCAENPALQPRHLYLARSQECNCQRSTRRSNRHRIITFASVPSFMSLPSVEGYIEVAGVKGVRLVMEDNEPVVQYLVEWKDGSEATWERGGDLSSDLVRDFEDKWWGAAKKAEFDPMFEMLKGGREVLSQAVDENRRSALHFAAALGKVDCVKLLLEAGADPNLQDTQGYTPLHMAAGYMHTSTMTALLEAGSDPQIKDNTGKDVVSLLEGLRNNMPLNLATVMTRLRLEEVNNALTDLLYEEIPAKAILEERVGSDGSKEYLVAWADGREDSWVVERDVSEELLNDWKEGMEGATAKAILDMVQVNTERRFKIQWSDDYPDSWEPEEHVPEALIALFKSQNPALFQERVEAAEKEMKNKQLGGRGAGAFQAAAPASLPSTPLPESVPVMIDPATVAAAQHQQQEQPSEQKDERVLAGSA